MLYVKLAKPQYADIRSNIILDVSMKLCLDETNI